MCERVSKAKVELMHALFVYTKSHCIVIFFLLPETIFSTPAACFKVVLTATKFTPLRLRVIPKLDRNATHVRQRQPSAVDRKTCLLNRLERGHSLNRRSAVQNCLAQQSQCACWLSAASPPVRLIWAFDSDYKRYQQQVTTKSAFIYLS